MRSNSLTGSLLWLVAIGLALAACDVEDTHTRCKNDDDCDSSEECYLGFCVGRGDAASHDSAQSAQSAQSKPDAGKRERKPDASTEDAGPSCASSDEDAGQSEGSCCQSPVSCYTGPEKTRDVGRCKSGKRACNDHMLGSCTGSIEPREETCDNQGSDDDCDGKMDNVRGRGDDCTPDGAAAMCGGGTRECMSGKHDLVCVPKKEPATEVCNQKDDDCDGKTDETFDLKTDAANCGSCGKTCGNNQACCSGSCQMRRTDTMNGCACTDNASCQSGQTCCNGGCKNIQTDAMNCGACGRACAQGQSCCAGACVDPRSDAANCGACGTKCARGTKPACCNGLCVDTTIDESNCGRCGTVCSGALCSCEPQNGNGVCTNILGGSC